MKILKHDSPVVRRGKRIAFEAYCAGMDVDPRDPEHRRYVPAAKRRFETWWTERGKR